MQGDGAGQSHMQYRAAVGQDEESWPALEEVLQQGPASGLTELPVPFPAHTSVTVTSGNTG